RASAAPTRCAAPKTRRASTRSSRIARSRAPKRLVLLARARGVVVAVAVRSASDEAVAACALAEGEREGDEEGDDYRCEHCLVLPVGVALCLHLVSIEPRSASRLCEVAHTGNRWFTSVAAHLEP